MEANGRSVLVLGATGLVGSACLRELIGDPTVTRINVLVRRPVVIPVSGKVTVTVADYDAMATRPDVFAVDQIICALGTTIKKAGSREAFRQVDYAYPLAAARLGLANGATHFQLVSALGASASSRIFYNRVKGELEDALRTLGYRAVTIVRPSLLVGTRKEIRLGEQIGRRFGWIVPGKYKPVAATDVAKALVSSGRTNQPGLHIIESDEIRSPMSSPHE